MKIYTRTGDGGDTALFGGARIGKSTPRVEAYGAVDELNACLGVALAVLDAAEAELAPVLTEVQADLFTVGAELATPAAGASAKLARRLVPLSAARTERLEWLIDRYEDQLEPLKAFILPGGTHTAAMLHLARTVARRAERRIVALASIESLSPEITRYMNRLSDLLFVLARTANRLGAVPETPWKAVAP